MARSTRLVILIRNIYTLWGRKRFLLPFTYFPTNLVYPFTIRVTGIIKPITGKSFMLNEVVVIEKNYKNLPLLQKSGSTVVNNVQMPAMKKKKPCKQM